MKTHVHDQGMQDVVTMQHTDPIGQVTVLPTVPKLSPTVDRQAILILECCLWDNCFTADSRSSQSIKNRYEIFCCYELVHCLSVAMCQGFADCVVLVYNAT